MRLIDVDAIQEGFVRGAMINCIVGVEGEIDQVEGGVTAFNQILDAQPTVDPWHYPSQGELPPRGEQVLCWLWNGNYVLAFIREDDEWTTNGKNAFDGVKCWQYLVPPKEQRKTENLKSCQLINDKHKDTASAAFGTPQNKVTSEQRNVAKAINFGIIYGRQNE